MSRTYVTFGAPGSRSSPPGAELAGAIRTALRAEFAVSEAWTRGDYGWEFEVTQNEGRCLLILQRSDAWLVIIAPLKRYLGLVGRPSEQAVARVARAVHRALCETRASSIRWFTPAEFHARAPGAVSPDDAA